MRSEAPTRPDLGEFMLGYGKAWNDHDPDAIAALHTEDTRFCTHGFGEPAEGRAAMRAAAAATFEKFPGFANEWTVVDGGLRVDCVDVVTVERDLVKTKDTYFDVAQLTRALGG
jgi:hypothetical protein